MNGTREMWICLEVVRWCRFQSPFVRTTAVQFSIVRITTVQFKSVPKHNSATGHNPAETARPMLNQHESVGQSRTSRNARSLLNQAKISKDMRPMKNYASALSLSVESYLNSLQTSYVFSWVLGGSLLLWCSAVTPLEPHYSDRNWSTDYHRTTPFLHKET